MSELGQMLREARESKGISLIEAEKATRIRRKYLLALEEANYEALPPAVYVRGFLRNYASYLGLDPETALAAYRNGAQSSAQPAEPHIISEPLTPSSPINWELIAGAVMLVALGVVLFLVYRQYVVPLVGGSVGAPAAVATDIPAVESTETPPLAAIIASNTSTPTPTATSTPTATATPTSPPPTPVPLTPTATQTEQAVATQPAEPVSTQELVLQLQVTAPSWVRVLLDGENAYEGILDPGEERTWQAQREISMRTGNAGGLTASLNGQNIGALGESGEVLDYIWRISDTGEILTLTPTP